jgi:glycosyltransferase involved in cell wall biosynthesis
VRDGENGLLLKEVEADVIADTVKRLLEQPELLEQLSANSAVAQQFSVDSLAESITSLI